MKSEFACFYFEDLAHASSHELFHKLQEAELDPKGEHHFHYLRGASTWFQNALMLDVKPFMFHMSSLVAVARICEDSARPFGKPRCQTYGKGVKGYWITSGGAMVSPTCKLKEKATNLQVLDHTFRQILLPGMLKG